MPDHSQSSAHVTSAIGMQETARRRRARRSSMFTKTVIWITALVCLACLLASLAQAWSNSALMGRVQVARQQVQQVQQHHADLTKLANHYNDAFVIESEARQQLGYIRPGEHPIIIASSPDQNQRPPSHHASAPIQQSFWQAWWNIFFGG